MTKYESTSLELLKEKIISQVTLFFTEEDPIIKQQIKDEVYQNLTIYHLMELYQKNNKDFMNQIDEKKKNNWLRDY